MDIEGDENPWIQSLNNEQLNKIDQIVVEFHGPFQDTEIETFNKLNKNHYLIHFHPNNVYKTYIHKNVEFPTFFECTYLKRKLTTIKNIPKINAKKIFY